MCTFLNAFFPNAGIIRISIHLISLQKTIHVEKKIHRRLVQLNFKKRTCVLYNSSFYNNSVKIAYVKNVIKIISAIDKMKKYFFQLNGKLEISIFF